MRAWPLASAASSRAWLLLIRTLTFCTVGTSFTRGATAGTYDRLAANDVPAKRLSKLAEGRPNIKDYIKNGKVQLIINTPTKKGPQTDEGKIRALAVLNKVPMVTTITGASASATPSAVNTTPMSRPSTFTPNNSAAINGMII